jgi:hypothetical protein
MTLQAVDMIDRRKMGERFEEKDIIIHDDINKVPVHQLPRFCKYLHMQIESLEHLANLSKTFGNPF